MRRPTALTLGTALVIAVGLLQPIGYVTRLPVLAGLGYLTVSSPLPLVFTDRAGMEDFASRYVVRWSVQDGQTREKQITSSDFAAISGPFNRRAVYAAAIAYAPRLSPHLWSQALGYGFCTSRVLSDAIGEPAPIASVMLTVTTRTRGRDDRWVFTIRCRS